MKIDYDGRTLHEVLADFLSEHNGLPYQHVLARITDTCPTEAELRQWIESVWVGDPPPGLCRALLHYGIRH